MSNYGDSIKKAMFDGAIKRDDNIVIYGDSLINKFKIVVELSKYLDIVADITDRDSIKNIWEKSLSSKPSSNKKYVAIDPINNIGDVLLLLSIANNYSIITTAKDIQDLDPRIAGLFGVFIEIKGDEISIISKSDLGSFR